MLASDKPPFILLRRIKSQTLDYDWDPCLLSDGTNLPEKIKLGDSIKSNTSLVFTSNTYFTTDVCYFQSK